MDREDSWVPIREPVRIAIGIRSSILTCPEPAISGRTTPGRKPPPRSGTGSTAEEAPTHDPQTLTRNGSHLAPPSPHLVPRVFPMFHRSAGPDRPSEGLTASGASVNRRQAPSRCPLVYRSRILCGHPLTGGVDRFPNLAGGPAGPVSARPCTVAEVHNHAPTQPGQTSSIA